MVELFEMSNKELSRYYIIKKLDQREIEQTTASQILKISIRQIRRLLQKYREQGPSGMISGHRRTRGNHQIPTAIKNKVLDVVSKHYKDFSLSLLLQKLKNDHQINISLETLRLWMLQKGVKTVKKRSE